MAEAIRLSTFHDHQLTDKDHALFMQTVTSQSGLFYGCEVTLKDENTLHISTGEGIACGRIFSIMDMDYPVELSASGDLLGRLYVHIDTALDDTPAQLMDVQGSTLPALIQEDDMNQSTGVYEIELATFSINELGISNLEFTAPKATGGGAGGKSIAPDYSATESYEKGRIFFQNGTLYKTIAAIPAGAPLVVDTNVVETSLAAEIEALNQNLTQILNPEYVEVESDGVKTGIAIYNELYSLIDLSKIEYTSRLVLMLPNGETVVSRLDEITSDNKLVYSRIFNIKYNGEIQLNTNSIWLDASSSIQHTTSVFTNRVTVGSTSSTDVMPSGRKLRVYYK